MNMEQGAISVVNKLPLLPEDSPVFGTKKNNLNAPGVVKILKSTKKTC